MRGRLRASLRQLLAAQLVTTVCYVGTSVVASPIVIPIESAFDGPIVDAPSQTSLPIDFNNDGFDDFVFEWTTEVEPNWDSPGTLRTEWLRILPGRYPHGPFITAAANWDGYERPVEAGYMIGQSESRTFGDFGSRPALLQVNQETWTPDGVPTWSNCKQLAPDGQTTYLPFVWYDFDGTNSGYGGPHYGFFTARLSSFGGLFIESATYESVPLAPIVTPEPSTGVLVLAFFLLSIRARRTCVRQDSAAK